MLMIICNTVTCYNYSKVVCLQMREYNLDGVWSYLIYEGRIQTI